MPKIETEKPSKVAETKPPKTNGKKPPKSAQPPKSGEESNGSASPAAKSSPKPKKVERPILYKGDPEVRLCTGGEALTAAKMKEILGWQEESENIEFKELHNREASSLYGKKVRLNNNITNRLLYPQVVLTLKYVILQGFWEFNGEPIIIGRTGLVLNGQHTALALILAAEEWKKDKEKWAAWKKEPTLEKLLVLGVSETDAVVNTMDTAKPRTLVDVLFRSDFFRKMKHGDRKLASSMTAHAIKMLWDRTGAKEDAFAPLRTHSESLDFLNRHYKLLEAVKHIFTEDEKGKISRYLSPGYSAALLYLMGSCTTAQERYLEAEPNSEAVLDWKMWDKACEFFVLIAAESPQLAGLREALGAILAGTAGTVSVAERCALLVKAWNLYSAGDLVERKALTLAYSTTEDGDRLLNEHPQVGGIDSHGT